MLFIARLLHFLIWLYASAGPVLIGLGIGGPRPTAAKYNDGKNSSQPNARINPNLSNSQQFNALPPRSNDTQIVIDTRCTFVLFSPVFVYTELRSANQNPRPPSTRHTLTAVSLFPCLPIPVSPLLATHTSRQQITENTNTLSPAFATHTDFAPVTPVFATHTKTTGVCTNNSHSGTHFCPSRFLYDLGVSALNPILSLSTFNLQLLTSFPPRDLSFQPLTNCPFHKPFVLTFMHRMGGVGGTLNIQTFKPANIPTLSQSSSHTGRIAKTIRSRRLKNAKNPNSCFHGKYFLLSKSIPRTASSQSPSSFPPAVHGAIRTRGLLRIRFTFPETPIVYAKSFAPLASSRTDGSAANHTGVFTPSPLFLNVSRFKYLCPANAANPIASPPAIPRKAFYAGRKKVGQTFLSVQGFPFVFWAHY